MSSASKFKHHLINLVHKAGGIVEKELFVTKPGVLITEKTETTPAAKELYNSLNFDQSTEDYLQAGEFKGRLTYLSFRKDVQSKPFHDLMIKQLKHLSIYAGTEVTFLIAGCSLETSLELIAHHEAKIARLTSSKTAAMTDSLYRVQNPGAEKQKQFIMEYLQLRNKWNTPENVVHGKNAEASPEKLNTEMFNMMNLACKATALTYTMSVKDLHKLFIGRLSPEGNETEVQEICSEMCKQLHQLYPTLIMSPEEYFENNKKHGNAEKLNIV